MNTYALSISNRFKIITSSIEKVIIGKPHVIKLCLVALLSRGHLLIEDIPGVGKTTLAQALARSIDGTFNRIQFTSDLLPSDIIGVSIYNQKTSEFEFKPGPIFANIILADEINRGSPRTQSSLLEAMNEYQVTIDNHTYRLPDPFLVIATQNPFDFFGTNPLPESQMDRFIMRISIGYPDKSDEKILLKIGSPIDNLKNIKPIISTKDVIECQLMVEKVRIDDSLQDYILKIVTETRKSEHLRLGVSPRGALFLQRASRALALLEGRDFCIPDDIKRLAIPVLSHRIIPRSPSSSKDAERILCSIIEEIPVPK